MQVLTLITILLFFSNSILAKDISVDPTNPAAQATAPCQICATIQAAVDSCEPGDTVLLAAGVYTGDGNINVVVNVAGIKIVGVVQATILDLGFLGHAFKILKPNVKLVNLIIKNGLSTVEDLAGAITARITDLPKDLAGAAVVLENVLFKDILGGALLVDNSGSSSSSPSTPSSTTPSTPSTGNSGSSGSSGTTATVSITDSGVVVMAQLLNTIFLNIALKPAVKGLGNIQVQVTNCQFQNNGLASIANATVTTGASPNNNGNVVGASVYVDSLLQGLRATLTLRGCIFSNNLGDSVIFVGGPNSRDQLVLVDVNTFTGNSVATAVIRLGGLSIYLCLACSAVWLNNVAPLLCQVTCSLLGINLLCPGSCPSDGLLGGLAGDLVGSVTRVL